MLLWQSASGSAPVTANPQYLRYQRVVRVAGDSGQSCAVVDPQIFPHAAPSLKDLRLYQDGREVPYAITLSVPQQLDSDTGRVRNLGLTVPPSREAQSLYTTAATTTNITQRGRQSVATFSLPERIPVERVSFDLAPAYKANFSRDIRITDRPEGTSSVGSESLAGTIYRVHLTQAGREIRQEQLAVPATLGSNMQTAATVEVAIDNGDDTPLPIST